MSWIALLLTMLSTLCPVAAANPTSASQPTQQPAHHPAQRVAVCSPLNLSARVRPGGEGATGHLLRLIDLRNAGETRCRLPAYPSRVTVSEPGRPPLVARDQSFFPSRPARPMDPGDTTTLGLESDSTCSDRPSGGPAGPWYHRVTIALRGGTIDVVIPARGIDGGCGIGLTRFSRWS